MSTLLLSLLLTAQSSAIDSTRDRVAARIQDSGAEVAVAFRTLDGHDELLIDADEVFHAASTMKVPVMIELFHQAAEGTRSLDDPLPILNEFSSIIDGSPYRLSMGDDSDEEVYARLGESMTLRELCEAMITVSSNFATNLLIDELGAANVRARVSELGADGMTVLRGVEDTKAFEAGKSNTTTARALLVLLEAIAKRHAVDTDASVEMEAILSRQAFRDAIPAGLPEGITVAHKTGNITRIHHDAAIVRAERPYVLVVLVRGIDDEDESASLIADISRLVYAHTTRTRSGVDR